MTSATKPRSFSFPFSSSLLLGLGLAWASGCETVPDPCDGYVLACIGVTVQSGPADVYRVRVFVDDGLDTSTVLTPKKEPKEPLTYPLRFAIKFGQFDNLFKGQITFQTSALSSDFDILGQTTTTVFIKDREKQAVSIDIGPPSPAPDMATPDMATPSPDLRSPPDLATFPDMP